MPASEASLPILRRVGWVLIALGSVDIALMIYCIIRRISYSSSFNIFALIAGIFLVRGSLGLASRVRFFGTFLFTGISGMVIAFPFLVPIGLLLAYLRFYPMKISVFLMFVLFVLLLLLWIIRELGKEPVLVAIATSGHKPRDIRIAAAAGVGLVMLLAVALPLTLEGRLGEQAVSEAKSEVGPGYRFFVTSINWSSSGGSSSVSAVVTAWNEKDIRDVPVHWETK